MKSKSDAGAGPFADGLSALPTIRRLGKLGDFTRSCGISLVKHTNNSLNVRNPVALCDGAMSSRIAFPMAGDS
jgi:hypothetical protein